MRPYPWNWTRRLDADTQTYVYTTTYKAQAEAHLSVEALAHGGPELQAEVVQELTEHLINQIHMEMEKHLALAANPLV